MGGLKYPDHSYCQAYRFIIQLWRTHFQKMGHPATSASIQKLTAACLILKTKPLSRGNNALKGIWVFLVGVGGAGQEVVVFWRILPSYFTICSLTLIIWTQILLSRTWESHKPSSPLKRRNKLIKQLLKKYVKAAIKKRPHYIIDLGWCLSSSWQKLTFPAKLQIPWNTDV